LFESDFAVAEDLLPSLGEDTDDEAGAFALVLQQRLDERVDLRFEIRKPDRFLSQASSRSGEACERYPEATDSEEAPNHVHAFEPEPVFPKKPIATRRRRASSSKSAHRTGPRSKSGYSPVRNCDSTAAPTPGSPRKSADTVAGSSRSPSPSGNFPSRCRTV